jgi:serine protease AprX
MQWVLENKETFNIRVVNLSVNSTMEQSYHDSPMNAAAEILWFNGIVVVASAGNFEVGSAVDSINTAPANDPFIITVGASDESQTPQNDDDTVAVYSAHGLTWDDFIKPDVIAPGQDIISLLSPDSRWSFEHPDRVLANGDYFRLSGTSMASPMVTGAVALLLQDEPELTPDQVKYRLMATGHSIDGSDGDSNTYAYLDVLAAVTGTSTETSNTGIKASQLLWSGEEPVTWESVNWNSVNWNSVNWNSVNWNSVNWNSVNWNSVAWDY